MKILIYKLNQIFHKLILIFFLFLFTSHKILANDNSYEFVIKGNENTDKEVIYSIIVSNILAHAPLL